MWNIVGNASQPLLGVLSFLCKPIRPGQQPITLPTGVPKQPPTPESSLEASIAALESKKKEWANLPCTDRAALLRKCIEAAIQGSEKAAKLMVKSKGSYGNGLGEERALLITPIYALREYAESLEAGGQPRPKKVYKRSDGQHVADVVPMGIEAMFFGGYRGEVWIEPGQLPSQGKVYRELQAGKIQNGSVSLVLGAGNQISVVLLDILYMLMVQNTVVICKFNPVLDYLGPFAEDALRPLVERGYVHFAYGDAQEGRFLCNHPKIEKIHLTGSAATYDAIVWGGPSKKDTPLIRKEITAELGCVTPYIVVPGNWSQQALEYYADECVAGLVNSSGHNCTKLELLVTCKEWPQREQFVNAVRAKLACIPRRVAWYPGSDRRHAAFKEKFKDAEALGVDIEIGDTPPTYLPWLFKAGLSPEQADTTTENWCGVLQEVALPDSGPDPAKFLETAVDFANNRCWGSLSCTVIAPPATNGSVLDNAVASLRYGTVAVNAPSFVGYSFPKLTWGAFPGNSPKDIGSGIGTVHNAMLFDNVQKSVLYSPWMHHPTHLWSPSVRNLDATTYRALRFLAYPSLLSLSTTAVNALRG